MKTLAIRLDDEQHARVGLLSKLSGTTVTDTIRTAIENHLEVLANDPTISVKAKELTAEIDKEAELQRQALAALFGSSTTESAAKTTPTTSRGSRSSGKG
jgi:predicted DNA-binding protein